MTTTPPPQPTPTKPPFTHEELMERAQAALDRYAPVLMAIPGVTGVGIGYATVNGQPTDEVALIVMVDQKLPRAQLSEEAVIPQRINGVRVDVQALGPFEAFSASS